MAQTESNSSTLKMVRRNGRLYAQTDDDFGLLHAMGVHTQTLTTDYMPVLMSLCQRMKVKLRVTSFEILEQQMVQRVTEIHWKNGSVNQTANSLTFSCPRDVTDAKVEKLISNLSRWYKGHQISLEVSQRRHSKTRTITLLKASSV
jgi:selenophosphate synthase